MEQGVGGELVCPSPPCALLPHPAPHPPPPHQRSSLESSDLRLLLSSGVIDPLSGKIKPFTPYVAPRPLSVVRITDVMISIETNLTSKKKTESVPEKQENERINKVW